MSVDQVLKIKQANETLDDRFGHGFICLYEHRHEISEFHSSKLLIHVCLKSYFQLLVDEQET